MATNHSLKKVMLFLKFRFLNTNYVYLKEKTISLTKWPFDWSTQFSNIPSQDYHDEKVFFMLADLSEVSTKRDKLEALSDSWLQIILRHLNLLLGDP